MSLAIEETIPGPHAGARIVTAGSPLAEARAAVVLCHGRGARAEDMLGIVQAPAPSAVALVAPQANAHTWYPYPFLAPLQRNEPNLSSALALLGAVVRALDREGVPPERQLLIGFSQGGCLALEFAGRTARRYGGVVGLSAGLIGPPGRQWNFAGTLDHTPVFLGCSDQDPHIPEDRVRESARELARIGGDVEVEIYPGLGHTVNQDELDHVRRMIDALPTA